MIKRFYVNNFRCLQNFEFQISEIPTSLLIGKNGSGKSTVGSALSILREIASGTNRVDDLVKPSDFSLGNTFAPIRFEIEVSLKEETYEYTLALELPEGFKALRVLEEKLSVDGSTVYSRRGAQVRLTRSVKDTEAAFRLDWHLIALPVIQEQSEFDPLYVFKAWMARMLILAPIPSLITGDSRGETLSPKSDVVDFGEWFSGLISYAPGTYTEIAKYLAEVLPDFTDVRNPVSGTDFRSLRVQFHQNGESLNLPFRALSDGEKCFFICAVVLAANRAYGPLFCFWDEPDNYLAPSEVGHFVMALRRSYEAGGQLLVTSHNIEAIRQFSNENTFHVYRRSHLEPSQVRLISEIPNLSGDLGNALIRGDIEL